MKIYSNPRAMLENTHTVSNARTIGFQVSAISRENLFENVRALWFIEATPTICALTSGYEKSEVLSMPVAGIIREQVAAMPKWTW